MEDEIDDKIIYQTYISHVKLMSRLIWSIPLNITSTSYCWRLLKMYIFKPEMLIFGSLIVIIIMYMQAVSGWSRNLLDKIQYTITHRPKNRLDKLTIMGGGGDLDKTNWEMKLDFISAYAIQGRRPKMEDRFAINDNINGTGISLFAVFDGHGGEFAANYAKEKLIDNIYERVKEIDDLRAGKKVRESRQVCEEDEDKENTNKGNITILQRKKSFKRTSSTTDECVKETTEITDQELLARIDTAIRTVTREVRPNRQPSIKRQPTSTYVNASTVDYARLLTDEVLAIDNRLLDTAKKTMDVAGTTALIGLIDGTRLIVANVGDSRGVMCDGRGNVIPLSFDHKPQQMRERKRIKEAGGFVTFNGVWRVAGILATSRALGDYPLKDKRLVIADPDILTFDLNDHHPQFLIIASDGLWDTFTNEEAIAYIKEHLNETDYGAKSLTLQSYYRGSLDNITVIVIKF